MAEGCGDPKVYNGRDNKGEDMIIVRYDGKYPNLCCGKMVVEISNPKKLRPWEFSEDCLFCDGFAYESDKGERVIGFGDWTVVKWPDGFPENMKQPVTNAVNRQVRKGCCGGCI